ncbi:hemicentin-1, partial [Plakobranchus ocellatus]
MNSFDMYSDPDQGNNAPVSKISQATPISQTEERDQWEPQDAILQPITSQASGRKWWIQLPATSSGLRLNDTTEQRALELYGNHPYFMSTPDFYTVEVGKMAVLKCAVTNLEDKQVIWRKASDSNPLTVGLESFYNTNRIVVQHLPRASQWNLVIHDVRLTDSGVYECQVSSKLRHLRQHVLLTVKEKEAETTHMPKPGIKVSGLAYVDIGDQIYLICNATGLEHSPSTIDWFRNGNKLTSRGKKVEIKDFVAVTSRTVVSFLQISDAQLSDSGVYVCRTSNLQIADLRVTVLNSDTSNVKR